MRQAVRATAELQAFYSGVQNAFLDDLHSFAATPCEARETGELPNWPQVLGDTLLLLQLARLSLPPWLSLQALCCQSDQNHRAPLAAIYRKTLWTLFSVSTNCAEVATLEAIRAGRCKGAGVHTLDRTEREGICFLLTPCRRRGRKRRRRERREIEADRETHREQVRALLLWVYPMCSILSLKEPQAKINNTGKQESKTERKKQRSTERKEAG